MLTRRVSLLFLALALLLVACGAQPADPDAGDGDLMALRLPMGFVPDPQYAPVYVAVERGYFADAGLSIEFDYSFETDGIALVGANELPFAIVSGEQVILGRAQGLPLVYVLEWFQRYPITIVSKAEAGIKRPEDLPGRSVGLPALFGASYVGYIGLLTAAGVDPGTVDSEDIGFTQVESLLTDRVEAVVVYSNNEPVRLRALGEEIDEIAVADYIDMVSNGIITNETTIAENPELVEDFVHAMLRGIADTLADPEAAYEISKKYVEGLDDSRMNVLEASLLLWEAETPGITDPASWEQTERVLLEMGLIDRPLDDLEAAYTNRFVQTIEGE